MPKIQQEPPTAAIAKMREDRLKLGEFRSAKLTAKSDAYRMIGLMDLRMESHGQAFCR